MADPSEFMDLCAELLGLDQPGMPGVQVLTLPVPGSAPPANIKLQWLASPDTPGEQTHDSHQGSTTGSGHSPAPVLVDLRFAGVPDEQEIKDRWTLPATRNIKPSTMGAEQLIPGYEGVVLDLPARQVDVDYQCVIAFKNNPQHYCVLYKLDDGRWSAADTLTKSSPAPQPLAELARSMQAEGFYPTRVLAKARRA